MLEWIAFDADDTLWHNESLYNMTEARFAQLLSPYIDPANVSERLYQTEQRNLHFYGYGVKSFTLSMIETAIELSGGQIRGSEIQQIIDFARWMLKEPVQLLPGVAETVSRLAHSYRMMVITKGDLFDQETKVARSGLADYFERVEVVSEKDAATYRELLRRHSIAPDTFLMVGNSVRSDVLPVVELGGQAVHIPYHITWQHEVVVEPAGQPQDYFVLDHIDQLPDLLARI